MESLYHNHRPRLGYLVLSQAMFGLRFSWPITTGEDTVLLASRRV